MNRNKANKDDGGVIDYAPFGKLSKKTISQASIESLEDLFSEIMQATEKAQTHKEWQDLENDADFVIKVDAFRAGVGSLYFKLSQNLDEDIKFARKVIDNFGKCMFVSLFTKKLKPQKYFNLCGMQDNGYGAMILRLVLMAGGRQKILQGWAVNAAKQFADQAYHTTHKLLEKEKKYRDASIAVAQVGVGVGGMLIGLLSLVLSLIVPFIISTVSDRKSDHSLNTTRQITQPKNTMTNQPPALKSTEAPKKDVK